MQQGLRCFVLSRIHERRTAFDDNPGHAPLIQVILSSPFKPDTGSFRSSHRCPHGMAPPRARRLSRSNRLRPCQKERRPGHSLPSMPVSTSDRTLLFSFATPRIAGTYVHGSRLRRLVFRGPDPTLPGAVRPGRWRTVGGGQTEREHNAWLPTAKSARTVESVMLCRQRQAVRQSSKFCGNRQATPRQRGTAHANIQTAGGRRIDRAASHRCFSFVDVDAR